MWHDIKAQEDITAFMESVYYFHDSCVREMHYTSGAYVDEDFSMSPINDKRILSVILQSQWKDVGNIELEFSKLKYMNLKPNDENYTCEILDASMYLKDGLIYWCDDDVLENEIENCEATLICAEKLRWRKLEI